MTVNTSKDDAVNFPKRLPINNTQSSGLGSCSGRHRMTPEVIKCRNAGILLPGK